MQSCSNVVNDVISYSKNITLYMPASNACSCLISISCHTEWRAYSSCVARGSILRRELKECKHVMNTNMEKGAVGGVSFKHKVVLYRLYSA